MSNVKGIVKKDLDKIFKFPGAFFSTIILPGLILFLIYAIMGSSFSSLIGGNDSEFYSRIVIVNAPESFEQFIDQSEVSKINYSLFNESEVNEEDLINQVKENEYELLVVFDKDFDSKIEANSKPIIKLYGNDLSIESTNALYKMNTFISQLKSQILVDKEIDPVVFVDSYNSVADEEQVNAFGIAMLLPMLIITFVFAGALGVGADAIAGEKERGTLSTLLMAPIRRNEIVYGKVISTSIISLLSALSSFIGIIASLPFAKDIFGIQGSVSYGIVSYIQLLIIIIVLAMLASSVILLFSALAKSVKEATNYAMPIYIVAILTAVVSMFSAVSSNIGIYLIPIYNIAIGIKGVLTSNIDFINFMLVIIANILYVILAILILVRMFRSEKILFKK